MTFTTRIFDNQDQLIRQADLEGKLSVTEQDLAAAGKTISFALSLPIKDIAGYFDSSMGDGPVARLDWTIEFSGAASCNYPILCFMSQGVENRYTLYADNLIDDFHCVAKMNQQTGCYDIRLVFANRKPARPFSLYLDTIGGDWTAAFARAMEAIRPQGKPDFPERAFDPVYCTWYAVHACLTPEYLDANAKLAAELGCGTFIVDDGWCIDEMKRVSPQTIGTWYDHIGDWEVSSKKLPAFRDNVAYAQKLGLRYLVWVSPFFAYRLSKFYQGLSDKERMVGRGEHLFDPACERPVRETLGKMRRVVRDLGLDGLKVDFLDYVPADPEDPRGREAYDFIRQLAKIIREEAGEDALIEFRQRYATPQMLDFATQFRAGDVPFDYLRNLCRIAAIRVLLGDQVPVHADPLFWREDELDLTVARHMIASLAGVPMVSMDLATLTDAHLAIVRHYLGFYKAHQATFAHGHWHVQYNGAMPAYIMVTRGKERIVILIDVNALGDAAGDFEGTTHVLNLGTKSFQAREAYAADGKPADGAIVPCGGRGIL